MSFNARLDRLRRFTARRSRNLALRATHFSERLLRAVENAAEPKNDAVLEVDWLTASRHLRSDFRDEWFPDPVRFVDCLAPKVVAEQLNCGIKGHIIQAPIKLDLPKKGNVLRRAVETYVYDRLVYQALADILAPVYDRLLSSSVYSHRTRGARDKDLFAPGVEAWQQFRTQCAAELKAVPSRVLLVTDLQDFYEHISHDAIIGRLRTLLPKLGLPERDYARVEKAIQYLSELLSEHFKADSGLPQNRDASSFCANMLLTEIDEKMQKLGYRYFRYMDDIRIVCDDEYQAKAALHHLIRALRSLRLHVNPAKTKLVSQTTTDLEEQREFIDPFDDDMQRVQALISSSKLSEVVKGCTLVKQLAETLMANGEVTSRKFRFCIARLSNISQTVELRDRIDLSDITDLVITQLLEQPWAADVLCQYLKVAALSEDQLKSVELILCDEHRNIYGWLSYHLWQVLILHKHSSTGLLHYAETLLKRAVDPALKAGGILYLGAIGDDQNRATVATNFAELDSFVTHRAALIAVHELDFSQHIAGLVKQYVPAFMHGTYQNLRQYAMGEYLTPPGIQRLGKIDNDLAPNS